MASSSGKSKKAKGKAKSKQNNKLIMILTVIIVVILILAIVIISVKGLWGTVIDYVKSLLGMEETPDNPPLAQGVAKLEGAVLEMRVLDIGQGDCILLIFPDGQIMVMDIGSVIGKASPWNVIDGNLKGLNITTIDYLFLTHTDYDHIRDAKKLIDNYEIKNFYFPKGATITDTTWENACKAAQNETYLENGVEKKSVYNENVGTYEIKGENWIMKCYTYDEADYPDESKDATNKNAVSPVCFLEYAERTIVLTGDSNYTNEDYLLAKGYFDNIDADVLKVAHHGSKTSTREEFLKKVDCEYAIISCGAGNKYGHPTDELLERLDKYVDLVPDDDYNGFAKVYRTDQDGTITVQIDEKGVMNLIADENAEKNTTTGTPYEINEAHVVAYIYSKQQEWESDELVA
ncbi:MAG: MBL fold metallo-hydrolase [Clostridiales bacterium]|nr:MBL fold metallo-hydrolase [Clostridiales bacterium]